MYLSSTGFAAAPPSPPQPTPAVDPRPAPAPGQIEHRFFILGCPRSGTTLLQRFFGQHPAIYAFPETGLLLKALGMRGRTVPSTWFGLSSGREWGALARLLARLGLDPVQTKRPRLLRASLHGITAELDRIALAAARRGFSEKTPRHYVHALAIPRLIPAAQVIHLIREGRDVVASIHDRALRFPKQFKGQKGIDYGIRVWNDALRVHLRAAGRPGHCFVFFDDLIARPEAELQRLCQETGLAFDPLMLTGDPGALAHVRPRELWKAGAGAVVAPAEDKFAALFTPAEQARITRRLHLADLGRLRERLGMASAPRS